MEAELLTVYQDGEITDPPIATTTGATGSSQYAIPRSSPNGKSTADSIFCARCLKNQHLFTTSLAQYLPDDPDDPEYAELEKGYFKFRKGLEERYPQVCSECEPKVLGRIQQAGYTAKTDHLRRIIDRSRKTRVSTTTPLDALDVLGRRLWHTGLALQLVWQLSAIHATLAQLDSAAWPPWFRWGLAASSQVFLRLPGPAPLLRWSILASVASVWWNPRFVQTVRGFTRHLIGLSNWYLYQVMIIAIRAVFGQLVDLPTPRATDVAGNIGVHLFAALFTIYVGFISIYEIAGADKKQIYVAESRAIRTDMTPLFGKASSLTLSPGPAERRPSVDDKKTMSDILDEILHSGPSTTAPPPLASFSSANSDFASGHSSSVASRSGFDPLAPRLSGNPFAPKKPASPSTELGSLNLSDVIPSSQDTVAYDEDMDWTPSQSQHRAFATYDPAGARQSGFNQAPVDANRSGFWYKVPPAPISMAQRARNPPQTARITRTHAARETFLFRPGQRTLGEPEAAAADGLTSVEFAQPSLQVPDQPPNDPRNSLSDLFGRSFTLSPEQESPGRPSARSGSNGPGHAPGPAPARRPGRPAELVLVVACLVGWLHAAAARHDYALHVKLGIICVCLAVSARVTGDSVRDYKAAKALGLRGAAGPVVGAALGVAELALACHFVFEILGSRPDAGDPAAALPLAGYGGQGTGLIGTMLVHQLWNLLM